MKLIAIAMLSMFSFSCTRADSASRTAPIVDASQPVVPIAPGADAKAAAAPEVKAPSTIDAYCTEFVARNDSAEGFTCRGETAHPTCDVKDKKTLPSLGTIVLVHEEGPDGTRSSLAIVDQNRHFVMVGQVPTEDCEIGDPADVSLQLTSAKQITDAGAANATIVYDSLRIDPPFQGGHRTLTAARRSVACRAAAAGPECDPPTTLGTFDGPLTTDNPPPFSQWHKG